MMRHPKSIKKMLILTLFAIILTPAVTLITANAAETTTNWKLNLIFQANNGTVTNSTTFAPFDLIQLTANLTNGNATIPQSTIVFNVKGPSSASYPTEIVRSADTDKTGSANITFRIPIEEAEKKVIGKWQVYVNAKTPNQTLSQNSTFQIAWPVQNLAIDFVNSTGQSKTNFNPGENAQAIITYTSISQTQNISLIIKDTFGTTITQQTKQVTSNATGNKINLNFTIPQSSPDCLAQAELNIYSGTFQQLNIPAAENKTAYFSIGNYTTPLPTQTSPTPTPTLTPTPEPLIENTLSLFSWLLVATGFFTFTALVLFLKRKTSPKIGLQMPIQATSQVLTAVTTSDSTEQNVPKTVKQTTTPAIITQIENSMNETNTTKPFTNESITTHLSRISSSTQRIQELKSILKEENEQLNKEISELNETLQRQETTIINYFQGIRNEVKKAQDAANNENANTQAADNKDNNNKE
jgi:hypothetical protein